MVHVLDTAVGRSGRDGPQGISLTEITHNIKEIKALWLTLRDG
jgi:hypothetical protein